MYFFVEGSFREKIRLNTPDGKKSTKPELVGVDLVDSVFFAVAGGSFSVCVH